MAFYLEDAAGYMRRVRALCDQDLSLRIWVVVMVMGMIWMGTLISLPPARGCSKAIKKKKTGRYICGPQREAPTCKDACFSSWIEAIAKHSSPWYRILCTLQEKEQDYYSTPTLWSNTARYMCPVLNCCSSQLDPFRCARIMFWSLHELPLESSTLDSHSSLPVGFFLQKIWKTNKQKGGKGHTEQPDEVPLDIK